MEGSALALGVAATALLMAAVALTRLGLRQPAHRGWPCWSAALLVGAVALPLGAPGQPAWALGLSSALLLCWPLLTLAGLRRFHARLGLPATAATDLSVGAVAVALVLAGAALGPLSAGAPVAATAAVLAQLYAAVILWSSRRSEDLHALRLLGTAAALAALTPLLLATLPGVLNDTVVMAGLLAAAGGLSAMAFTVLALMNERIERELRASRSRLRVLANIDSLTGVPNRRRFHERVERLLATERAESTALLLFDIDHFKLINDRLGHAAGDRALRLVGRCMQEALRTQDLAGRLGGDEFALLLRGTSVEQAMAVAERIVERLQAVSPRLHLPCLALSFGIAQLIEGEPIEDALHRADQALYEAKRQGRSRAVVVDGGDDEPQFSESRRLGLTTA